jgi:hypothetical protein
LQWKRLRKKNVLEQAFALFWWKVLNLVNLDEKWVIIVKPYGIGLIILLISFAMGAYATYVSYNFLVNPPNYQDAAELTARTNELKTATLIGLISSVIAIVGVLVFLVEFMKHEHGAPSARIPSPP